MPPVINGFYRLQFGLAFPPNSNLPKPKPLYLTNNGEGKQLTVEEQTDSNQHNQEWNILPPLTGEKEDLDRVIIPALAKDPKNLAVSQNVVEFPDDVALIKNLQVWTFQQIGESDQTYEIRSNLYGIGTIPLLGTDKEFKKAIIQFILVGPDPSTKPVWTLIGPLDKK